MNTLGIDIGGTGIKGAPVNTQTGELLAERYRLLTPQPSTPAAVAETVAEITRFFDWHGPVGIGFPAVVRHGVTMSAANVDQAWIGTDAATLFTEATGCPVRVINDADAAGIAEMRFGSGVDSQGVALIVTIGTGLGTALFVNGQLVPNTELGHIEIDGKDAEWKASEAAKTREDLSWKKWAKRFNRYLQTLEKLLSPDMIILGGGASKEAEKFVKRLEVKADLKVAAMLNEAGIVGAALAAQELVGTKE
ncbi:MAG TPA: ROK family protein [Anaerolineales bacterium]|nr:ROK family protein [Anaerolineales bacterium]